MRDSVISINCIDRTISVDGEAYHCPDMPETAAGTRAIHWNPQRNARKPGTCECEDSHKFADFQLVEHFLLAWKVAKAQHAAQEAEREGKAKAVEERERRQEAEARAERAEQEAHHAKRRAYNEALHTLHSTDWKVIRAMEAKLAAEGSLDVETVKARSEARQIVERERKKL